MVLKTAINWRDCYKNLFLTFKDLSNWLGPTAKYIDFCDFHSDEDLMIYTYNPLGLSKDTGDVTFLKDICGTTSPFYDAGTLKCYDFDGTVRDPLDERRYSTSSKPGYYRDCVVFDDVLVQKIIGGTFSNAFAISFVVNMLASYLEPLAQWLSMGPQSESDFEERTVDLSFIDI